MVKKEVRKHILVPKHVKLSDKEKKELFKRFNITLKELPKISKKDAALVNLDVKPGDIIKVTKKKFNNKLRVFLIIGVHCLS